MDKWGNDLLQRDQRQEAEGYQRKPELIVEE